MGPEIPQSQLKNGNPFILLRGRFVCSVSLTLALLRILLTLLGVGVLSSTLLHAFRRADLEAKQQPGGGVTVKVCVRPPKFRRTVITVGAADSHTASVTSCAINFFQLIPAAPYVPQSVP